VVVARDDIDGSAPERTHVRFVGGPLDGMASYYFGVEDRPPMACADGAYVFVSPESDGVVYVFRVRLSATA
jgi:hypothetical protein